MSNDRLMFSWLFTFCFYLVSISHVFQRSLIFDGLSKTCCLEPCVIVTICLSQISTEIIRVCKERLSLNVHCSLCWCGETHICNELSVIDRTCPSLTPSPSPAITCRKRAVTLCWRPRSHSPTALSTAAVVRTTDRSGEDGSRTKLDGQPGKHLGRGTLQY